MKLEFCPLFSGSSGNCVYIASEHTRLLVDVGLAAKHIAHALDSIDVDPASIDGILITHEHSDHISGAGVFSRRYDVPVYANKGTWEGIGSKAGDIRTGNARIFDTGKEFYVRDIAVRPFKTPHDANESVGYALHTGNKKACVATDIGYIPQAMLDELADSDIILLESNHDVDMLAAGRYPQHLKRRILSRKGHLSNDAAGDAIVKLHERNVRRFILGHLSKDNNREDIAKNAVCNAMEAAGIAPGKDALVALAYRDRASGLYVLD